MTSAKRARVIGRYFPFFKIYVGTHVLFVAQCMLHVAHALGYSPLENDQASGEKRYFTLLRILSYLLH